MKINLGCGSIKYDGFKNVDILDNDNVDIVHDLNILPWPFEDNSIDEIIAEDVLEHLQDTPAIINELWRVLKEDGIVTIQVPDVIRNPMSAFTDPTHIRYFTEKSFDYWDEGTEFGTKYGYYYDNKFIILNKSFPSGNIRVVMKKED
jgi:ubiquinone/menaquinone biosynthesis C-methylase UbiE